MATAVRTGRSTRARAAARRFSDAGAIVAEAPAFLTREMLDGLDDFWRQRAWADISGLPAEKQALLEASDSTARAKLLIEPSATRDRLTAGMYIPDDEHDPVGVIEHALNATIAAESIEARVRAAQKKGLLQARGAGLMQAAFDAGLIDDAEFALIRRRDTLRDRVVRVDDFPQDFGVDAASAPPAESHNVTAIAA